MIKKSFDNMNLTNKTQINLLKYIDLNKKITLDII